MQMLAQKLLIFLSFTSLASRYGYAFGWMLQAQQMSTNEHVAFLSSTTTRSLQEVVESFPVASLIASSNDDDRVSKSLDFILSSTMSSTNFFVAGVDGGLLDSLRNVGLGITAILFSIAGIALLYASIIVPAAANELEKECKDLAPELWEEYESKLKIEETMAQRPDLMQELGNKLQPLLEKKIRKKQSDGELSPLATIINPFTDKDVTDTKLPGVELPPATMDGNAWDSDDVDISYVENNKNKIIDVSIEKKDDLPPSKGW